MSQQKGNAGVEACRRVRRGRGGQQPPCQLKRGRAIADWAKKQGQRAVSGAPCDFEKLAVRLISGEAVERRRRECEIRQSRQYEFERLQTLTHVRCDRESAATRRGRSPIRARQLDHVIEFSSRVIECHPSSAQVRAPAGQHREEGRERERRARLVERHAKFQV